MELNLTTMLMMIVSGLVGIGMGYVMVLVTPKEKKGIMPKGWEQ